MRANDERGIATAERPLHTPRIKWAGLAVSLLAALHARAWAAPLAEAGPPVAAAPPSARDATALDPASTAGPTLTLAQAVAFALAHQPTVRQAQANTDAAAGRVEQARAGYLPQASATAQYQRTTANFAPRPGTSPTIIAATSWNGTTYNYFSFGANASQLIYDFGQTSSRWRAAEASEQSSLANQHTAEQQSVLGVRRFYMQARAQQDLVAVARQSVANQDKHLRQIQAFVTAGLRPEIDLASARTALANARLQLVQAENGEAVARAQLEQAMGEMKGEPYALADEEVPPVPGEDAPNPGQLVEQAWQRRPELVSWARAKAAQEETLAAARGGYGPSLAANAGASLASTTLDKLVPNWFLGATLTFPFLQGGYTAGLVHEARATLSAVTAQGDAARLQVRVDVEQALLAVRAAKAGGAAAQDALQSAREQLRLAEGRYQNGLGNVVELSDAQVAYTNAAAQAVQTHYDLSTARAQLLTACGIL